MKTTTTFEVIEDDIIDSTSESAHEVKETIVAALELYVNTTHHVVESRNVQIAQKLLEDVNA